VTLELGAVTFDAEDPHELASFWAALLETTWRAGHDLPEVAVVPGAEARPTFFFLPVPEAKTAKNRCHVDLHTAELDEQVGRACRLGAVRVAEHDHAGRWVVLADPEGNEFCIVHDPALV
jgi:predicted enzyme related to lactoylglutathione lyase